MQHRHRSKLAKNTRRGSPGEAFSAVWRRLARADSGGAVVLAAVLIVAATIIAYSNSLRCPFIFDDEIDIVDNASIRHLWPIWDVFFVPSDGRHALHGRPVVNLSLALNYAIGGLEPFPLSPDEPADSPAGRIDPLWNRSPDALAAQSRAGVLPRPRRRWRWPSALIWTLHPLQTEAVTYVVQRYESMMGLFYLLALYAAIRCGTSAHPRRWAAAAVAATLLAMGCKEVAVSIPITILLYDRAFLAGSFREAWRRRWGMYVGLAAAWAAFAVLFLFSCSRGNWAGYGLPVSWIEYARSQFGVILHYLRLSFWPHPLVLDYGWPVARTVGEILPGLVVIGGLAAATVFALIRWPKWGFLGAWFFLILAPTSSVMPLADLAFEHRMYLPLAAVATGVVVGGWLAGRWLVRRGTISLPASQVVGRRAGDAGECRSRNSHLPAQQDYRSEFRSGKTRWPRPRAMREPTPDIGLALQNCNRLDEAIVHYRTALAIYPDFAEAHFAFALSLFSRTERRGDRPLPTGGGDQTHFAEAHNSLGLALSASRTVRRGDRAVSPGRGQQGRI